MKPHSVLIPCENCGSNFSVMRLEPGFLLCAYCRPEKGFCVECGYYRPLELNGDLLGICAACMEVDSEVSDAT